MKTYLLPLCGSLLGGAVTFWMFAVLFTTPVTQAFPKVLFPLALAAAASFALARLAPRKWKLLAVAVALPTLLLAALLLIALWTEGRSDWRWALVAGAVLAVCMVSGWLARAKNESSERA
ncbi:hypothetical protein SAMN05216350_106153 [Polaromonas sp. YR568]|uniref:hypothetical protein n=1 Tax=Polaromonas sp. YR568 TaxID=1855301 RepID=UPI0008E47CC1|nr:hypothetical protein [Polaromonas sp. YR568]SFU84774.1 hypothetical protein SAMN05216350_106153 [Polaromonas sp. YR568]